MFEIIENIYAGVEEKFYNLMDFLSEKGVPVDAPLNFLEEKGIPAFPATIAILTILLLGGIFAFTSLSVNTKLSFSIVDEYGNSLTEVKITVLDSSGKTIKDSTLSHNGTLNLENLLKGIKFTVKGEKTGYAEDKTDFYAKDKIVIELKLTSKTSLGDSKIKVIDDKGYVISGAKVKLTKGSFEDIAYTDASGTAIFSGVPLNTELSAEISANNYKTINQIVTLREGEIVTMETESLNSGELQGETAKLIVSIKDEQRAGINGAEITAYNNNNGLIIDTKETANGRAILTVGYGKEIRLVIKKEGYAIYDDEQEGTTFSMDSDEKTIERILLLGKYNLDVFVKDSSGQNIENATIILYNSNGSKVQEAFGSQTRFEGIPEGIYYTGAYAYGYLPNTQEVDFTTGAINLILTSSSTSNSGFIPIFVQNYEGTPVSNAKIEAWIEDEETTMPYAIEDTYTDISGSTVIQMKYEQTYRIIAKTETASGSEYITPVSSSDNTVRITIYDGMILRELEIRKNGLPIDGTIIITSEDGLVTNEYEFTDGKASFYAKEGDKIEIVSGDDRYSTTLGKEGKLEIDLGKTQTAKITFLGAYYNGKKADSLSPDYEYELRFEVEVKGVGGGFVKIGDKENAEDEEYSIYCSDCRLGKTYTNNEYYDRARKTSRQGKWAEYEFENSKKILKLKLKINSDFEGLIPIYYRTWAVIDGEYVRAPYDNELGTDKHSSSKQALYAETYKEDLVVLRKKGQCSEEFCISYFFDNSEWEEEGEFWTAVDKENKLVTEIIALKSGTIQQTATGKNADIGGTKQITESGYTGDVSEAQTTGKNTIEIEKGETKSIVYNFTSGKEGESSITIDTKMTKQLTKTLNFTTYVSKDFIIDIPAFMEPTDKLKVKLEGDKDITEALVSVYSNGNLVYSMQGNKKQNYGAKSTYLLKYTFRQGEYKITVEAKGYNKQEKTIIVSNTGILEVPEKLEYYITENTTKTFEIKNNSDYKIENLGYELEEINKADIDVKLNIPVYLNAKESANASLNLTLKNKTEQTGIYNLYITGNIGQAAIRTPIKLTIYKNQTMNPSCLQSDRTYLLFNFSGEQGVKGTGEITFTNYCKQDFSFIVTNTLAKEGITISQSSFEIKDGETKTFAFDIENSKTIYNDKIKELKGSLLFEDTGMSKEIGLITEIVNPAYYLDVPKNLALWPSYNPTTKIAFDSKTISVKNTGKYSASGISMTFYGSVPDYMYFYSSNPTEGEEAEGKQANIGYISPGATNDSQQLQVKYNKTTELDKEGYIYTWATINGTQRNIGKTKYNVTYSGINCLKIADNTNISIVSETLGTTQSKTIKVKNECKETVNVYGLNPSEISGNTLSILGATIVPDTEAEIKITMNITSYAEDSRTVMIKSSLIGTGNEVNTPVKINTKISSKEGEAISDSEVSYDAVAIPQCDNPDIYETVIFPKMSATCTSGYCESQDLAKLINTKIKSIKSHVINLMKNKNPMDYSSCNFSASNNVCTFESLGIQPETFTMFFKNDKLTPAMLEEETKISNNEKYTVVQSAIPKETIGTNLAQIHYQQVIQDCGKYEIEITGIVAREGNKFSDKFSGFSFEIKVIKQEDTKGCEKKIENLANYVVYGKGVTTTNNLGIKPTLVEKSKTKDADYSVIANKIAQSVLGDLLKSTTSVEPMDFKIISGGAGKNRMQLHMNEYLELHFSNPIASTEVASKEGDFASAVLKSYLNGSLKDGCIGQNHDYVGFNKASESENLVLKINESPFYFNNKEVCREFELTTIANLKVNLTINTDDFEKLSTDITVRLMEEQQGGRYTELLDLKSGNTIQKTFKGTKKFQVCILGGNNFYNLSDTSIMNIEANIKGSDNITKEIPLKICSTDLGTFSRFVSSKITTDLENDVNPDGKSYAAYLNWPEKGVNQGEMEICMRDNGIIPNNYLGTAAMKKVIDDSKDSAAYTYIGVCSTMTITQRLVEGVCLSFATFGIGAIIEWAMMVIDLLQNCILPATPYLSDNSLFGLGKYLSSITEGIAESDAGGMGFVRFLTGISKVEDVDAIGEFKPGNWITPLNRVWTRGYAIKGFIDAFKATETPATTAVEKTKTSVDDAIDAYGAGTKSREDFYKDIVETKAKGQDITTMVDNRTKNLTKDLKEIELKTTQGKLKPKEIVDKIGGTEITYEKTVKVKGKDVTKTFKEYVPTGEKPKLSVGKTKPQYPDVIIKGEYEKLIETLDAKRTDTFNVRGMSDVDKSEEITRLTKEINNLEIKKTKTSFGYDPDFKLIPPTENNMIRAKEIKQEINALNGIKKSSVDLRTNMIDDIATKVGGTADKAKIGKMVDEIGVLKIEVKNDKVMNKLADSIKANPKIATDATAMANLKKSLGEIDADNFAKLKTGVTKSGSKLGKITKGGVKTIGSIAFGMGIIWASNAVAGMVYDSVSSGEATQLYCVQNSVEITAPGVYTMEISDGKENCAKNIDITAGVTNPTEFYVNDKCQPNSFCE